ncbi:MAG: hypothetical protein [Circular genetic element sp.]|nr:MAG: hypothetical protein [Circular genetic element sp.]
MLRRGNRQKFGYSSAPRPWLYNSIMRARISAEEAPRSRIGGSCSCNGTCGDRRRQYRSSLASSLRRLEISADRVMPITPETTSMSSSVSDGIVIVMRTDFVMAACSWYALTIDVRYALSKG